MLVRGFTRAKRQLAHLIKVPMDKGPGEVLICCPKFYNDLYDKTFRVGDGHYEATDMEEAAARKFLQQQWKQNGWEQLASFYAGGQIPVAYVLPKSKDLCKGRPIVPYCNHPCRRLYKLVGRALSYFARKVGVPATEKDTPDDPQIDAVGKDKRAERPQMSQILFDGRRPRKGHELEPQFGLRPTWQDS